MGARLVCNSVGIRGIARVLQIATATVLRLIKRISNAIYKPLVPLNQKSFEIDELRTFISNKKKSIGWPMYYAMIQKGN